MSAPGYRLAELFALRPTGVPFEALEALATPAVAAEARALLTDEDALAAAARRAAAALERRGELSAGQRERLRRRLQQRAPIAGPAAAVALAEVAEYARLRERVAAAEQRLGALLAREHEACRDRLYAQAAAHLPDLAVLQLAGATLERLLATRTHRGDRTLAIWLQRVCAKNDTISRFGPSAWGVVDPAEPGLRMAPRPGIARRVVWIERWVVCAVIDAINADPAVREEVAPRAVPGAGDPARAPALTAADRALLARCDGRTPAHALGAAEDLARLEAAGALRWRLEPLFIDHASLATLAADLASWRDGPPRRRWEAVVERLAAAAEELRGELDPARRGALIAHLGAALAELAIAPRQRTGRLYEAANPIVENCCREGDFALGAGPVDELLRDAAPWFDLFRDAAAFAADRVFDGLGALHREAPRRDGRVILRDLLALGQARGFEPGSLGPSRLAEEAFREVRAGFARQLAGRADAPEWELTEADCHFLRGRAAPRPELAYPSADLQIAAASSAAVARGDYLWVVSEVHHAFAMMGQTLAWSCPDRPLLAARLREAHHHAPTVYFDSPGVAHAPAHISIGALLDGIEPVHFATEQRVRAHQRAYSPDLVAVELDEARRDLRLRCLATGADLGTMLPLPRFFFGLHPFFPLQLEHHTPRLRRGRTVLQRRGWSIRAAELGGPFGELSPRLALAIERLRRDRDLPRWVFMRLRSDVLSGADSIGRRKDAKPICIDLESYVAMEVLARRLQKYGAVELVEMLPSPEQLVWQEADGRRCCELRTLLLPPAAPADRVREVR